MNIHFFLSPSFNSFLHSPLSLPPLPPHTHTLLSLFTPSNTNTHSLFPPCNTQTLSALLHSPGVFFLHWVMIGWPLSVRFSVPSPSVITECTSHTSSMYAPSTTGSGYHGYCCVAIVTMHISAQLLCCNIVKMHICTHMHTHTHIHTHTRTHTHTQGSKPRKLWSCC